MSLSPEFLARYEKVKAHSAGDDHLTRTVMAFYQTAASGQTNGLSAGALNMAFLSVYNKVLSITHGGLDQVQVDAARIWGGLSGAEKLRLIEAPQTIDVVVATALAADPKLAAWMRDQQGANGSEPGAKPGDDSFFKLDPLLRNTQFARNLGGAGIGGMDRGGQYTDLSVTGYNAAYPGRPWKLSEGGYQQYAFGAVGLNFSAAQDMANQGFSPESIKAAARFTGSLGIDVNQNAAAVARLRRDVPDVETGLTNTKDNWEAVGKLLEREREARERGDTEGAEKARKAAEEARKKAEEHDRQERERVQKTKPERVDDLEQIQNATKLRGLGLVRNITPDKSAQKEIEAAVEATRRDPNDAEAKKKLAALRGKHGTTKESQEAFAALEKEVGVKLGEIFVEQRQRDAGK